MDLCQVNQLSSLPAKYERPNTTMTEINKTLTLDYMLQHEPFEILPAQYFPDEECDHYPPIFDYGFALTDKQASDYAREQGIIPADVVEPSSGQWSVISWRILCVFNDALGLRIPGQQVELVLPCINTNVVILKIGTNYEVPFPPKKARKLLEMMKEAFKVPPTWYLSQENGGELEAHYHLDRISPKIQRGMEVLSNLRKRKDEVQYK
ncbi:hypothetical protein E1B28_011784 [Marasmius oreades]|uniref:Uncharacterized protein n=1 Tax=Marasmius oreades TaxID=181124 RepID=A0A9P7RV08_9AGAR|nr:uncharacterized protein E1B28_011784 [Marasmius oreades]KAG7090177.1 hypothetical protein E1B28_011784 [Marasmius oreades]